MKQMVLAILLTINMYGAVIGCKKQDSMLAIAGARDRVETATALVYGGECAILRDFTVVGYDMYYAKVLSSNGTYYWVLKNML